jgi:hypothetical protein
MRIIVYRVIAFIILATIVFIIGMMFFTKSYNNKNVPNNFDFNKNQIHKIERIS